MISRRALEESAFAISSSCRSATPSPRTGVSGSIPTAISPRMRAVSTRIAPQSTVPKRGAEVAAGEDVLGDGQILEDRRLLVHGDDAQPVCGLRVGDPPRRALDRDLALVGLDDPGQDLDERRLAGAVLADERVDGAGTDREAHLGDCLDAAVAPRDAAQLHERSGRWRRRSYAIVGGDSHELNGFKHIV